MKVYEALANALAEESDVSNLFGLIGDGNLRFLTYWATELDLNYYSAKHEATAIAMADGYARVSGKVGVCTVTQGPGLTNAITALVTARKASTPLVLLAGDVPDSQSGWPQDIDQDGIFAAASVPSIRIDSASTPLLEITRAVELAKSTQGPVGVSMPVDIQEQEWVAWSDGPCKESFVHQSPSPSELDRVRLITDMLIDSKRPVIIAGRGAGLNPNCGEHLKQIADHIGALMATSLRGKGQFDDSRYSLGIAGGLGTNLAAKLIGEADLVLVVGASMNDFTTLRRTLIGDSALVVRIDIDANRRDQGNRNEVFIQGDAALTSEIILAELGRRRISKSGYRTDDVIREIEMNTPESEFLMVEDPCFMDPRAMTAVIDDLFPKDRVVVTDAGHFFGNPCSYMKSSGGRSFVSGIDFGSIGLGLGLAMGASIARSALPTIVFVGDGGLMMSLGDLESVARYGLPMLIVVMNDSAYGSELQIMRMWDQREDLTVFPDVNFADVAGSLGMPGRRVASLEELTVVLSSLNLNDGPFLLDCAISRKPRAPWLEEAFTR